nr:hypothetical protein CFP56_66624 [Quercus suber]
MELASSSSVFAPSSSSSSNDVTAPNMADPSAAEDLKLLWPAPVEKTEMEWGPDTNTVIGSDEAWSDAMKLFHTVAQTSSAQHVSADDVDEQGSNPKGKQPAHSGTSTGKKRKAGSLATESRKTVESAQVPDPYSMAKAMEILNSMSDFNNETFYKALIKLEKFEWRQVFINLNQDTRRGWVEYLLTRDWFILGELVKEGEDIVLC